MPVRVDEVIGKYVVTSDAFILGTVQDFRCESLGWTILGIKMKMASGMPAVVGGKSVSLLEPGNYSINDVVLIKMSTDGVRSKLTQDDSGLLSLTSMVGMKVYSSDATLIGTIESFEINCNTWKVLSMIIKMDKTAYDALEVRKGLRAKRISGIKMSDVQAVNDSIILRSDVQKIKSQMVIS